MALPFFKAYKFNLQSGSTQQFNVSGRAIACTAAGEAFGLQLNGGTVMEFNQGLSFPDIGAGLQSVTVSALPGAALPVNAITLYIGTGDLRDLRFNVTAPLQISAGAIIQSKVPNSITSGTDEALAAAGSTLTIAANASREEVILQNFGPGDLRFGSAAAATNCGILLKADESFTLRTSAAVKLYALGACSVSITQTIHA